METDPTLTRSAFAEALGGALPDSAVDRIWQTVGAHLDTRVEHPSSTFRPAALGSDESVLDRLNATRETLVFADEIGRGGMGVVRLAEQTSVGRNVAVKSLRPDFNSPGGAVALLHEAWVTGAVEHPNIVPLYDVGADDDGKPLVVLKLIEGTAWRDLIDEPDAVRERFGVVDVLAWHLRTLMQVCAAAHFAHARGIVHRDLKPENVMIGHHGEVYLVDWGLARAFRDVGDGRLPKVSAEDGIAGTPAYMAPEMFGGQAADARTDVYLLGATLYYLIAGDPPHEGGTIMEIMMAVLRGPPDPEAPEALLAICRRAMAVDREARHQSAEDLRQDLQRHLEHRHVLAMVDDAQARLRDLEAGLAADRGRVFAECRFGFQQALDVWPECAPARAGLNRALTVMIEQALADEQITAAAALLAELPDPPEALSAAVDTAQADADARDDRLRRLELLQDEFDIRANLRPRVLFFSAIVTLLMLGPASRLLGWSDKNIVYLWPLLMLVSAGAIVFFGRRWFMGNAINRRLTGMLMTVMVAYAGLSLGFEVLDLDMPLRGTIGLHFGAVAMGMFSIVADMRGMLAASVYFLGFLISAFGWIEPDLALILAHGCLAISIIWIGNRLPTEGTFMQIEQAPMRRRLQAKADADRA